MDMETLVAWLDEQIRLCERGMERARADAEHGGWAYTSGRYDTYKSRAEAFRATRGFIIREEEEGSN